MSATCTKQFTLSVLPGITLPIAIFYPFDEDYSLDPPFSDQLWHDTVQDSLVAGPATESKAGGILGRCRSVLNWTLCGGVGVPVSCNFPELAYSTASEGFSVWTWFRKSAPASVPNQVIPLRLFFYTDWIPDPDPQATLAANYIYGTTAFSVNFNSYSPLGVHNGVNVVINPPPWAAQFAAGDWVFLGVTWTASDQLIRVYQNDFPVVVGATPVPMYDIPYGLLSPVFVSGTGSMHVDEVGVSVQKAATAAQMLGLYNNGNGLSWPDVQRPEDFP